MIEKSTDRIYPKYSDFEDLDVTLQAVEDQPSSIIAVVAGFLCCHTTCGAIALVTLFVFAFGFWTTNDVWGLFAIDMLIAVFSVFAIIVITFGETRGRKKEKTPCGTYEYRDESASASDS